ncbi:TPA: hypothetical protein ACGSTL_001436 [Vibrio parahaemolyticus]|uniref:hypothetical protein n=1 Tax=Vibrio campbellii TaxID=680 RepID=UPI001F086799|nr:hypothetical protein [Vibrio campbellii]UMM06881.1 hypothetical protein MKR81_26840 [Vibrio campbellii]
MLQKQSRFQRIIENARVVGGLALAVLLGGYTLHNLNEDEIRENQRKEIARTTVVELQTELERLPAGESTNHHSLEAECVQGIYFTKYRYREIPLIGPDGKAELCDQRDSLTYKDFFGDYSLRCINDVLYLNESKSIRYGGGPVALYDSETGFPKSCDLHD